MKKFILSAIAASLVVSPILTVEASAQTRSTTTVQHKANGSVVRKTTVVKTPNRVAYRKWNRGQRFDRRYAQNYRVVDYRRYRARKLYAPPRGYHWVRSGNDAVLVGVTSGVIGAVLANALR